MSSYGSAGGGGRRTRKKELRPVVSYPRDAVVDKEQLAAGLGFAPETAERHNFYDLPTVTLGGRLRWVWGQVIDTLKERAA